MLIWMSCGLLGFFLINQSTHASMPSMPYLEAEVARIRERVRRDADLVPGPQVHQRDVVDGLGVGEGHVVGAEVRQEPPGAVWRLDERAAWVGSVGMNKTMQFDSIGEVADRGCACLRSYLGAAAILRRRRAGALLPAPRCLAAAATKVALRVVVLLRCLPPTTVLAAPFDRGIYQHQACPVGLAGDRQVT